MATAAAASGVHRRAGPGAHPGQDGTKGAPTAPRDLEALDSWLDESTGLMLTRCARPARTAADELVGPLAAPADQRRSGPPPDKEIAVHTYDAQLTQGRGAATATHVEVEGVGRVLTTVYGR